MKQSNRRYWVVSPNVKNDNHTVDDWRRASVSMRAAFMGWRPDNPQHGQMGPKFAGMVADGIEPGDVILIARRYGGAPEVVGFGVVRGDAYKTIPGFKLPTNDFGSLRRLQPFVPWSGPRADVPFAAAVTHTRALARLHPDTNDAHKMICQWMEERLAKASSSVKRRVARGITGGKGRHSSQDSEGAPRDVSVVSMPGNYQLDYEVRSTAKVRRAKRQEARLLDNYVRWLEDQDRKLETVKYGALQCDGYEESRENLIEAKCSASREHIRMAVGQLLDYAFQGKSKLGVLHLAVLLPERPPKDVEAWLGSINIGVIWPDRGAFLDNSNGQFT